MKNKLLISLLPLSITLSGCFLANKPEEKKLSIICPTGAPSVAFYNYSTDTNFSTNNNPTNIASFMNNGTYDVVVLDTPTGVQAINAGAKYKIATTITLGNFYLASTSEENNTLEKTDRVVLFGTQASLPYRVFTKIFGDGYSIDYCSGGVTKAANVLETGKNPATGRDPDWVFIAEPYLYNAKNNPNSILKDKDYKVIDIQEEYKKVTSKPLMQASVFIKDGLDKDLTDKFLSSLKDDIEKGIADPTLISTGINEINNDSEASIKYGATPAVLEALMRTNRMGLGYLNSKQNINSLNAMLEMMGIQEFDAKNCY